MDSKRLATATGMFLILSLVFSGVAGFAAASNEPHVFVPSPRPGDAAHYDVVDVIVDPDVARGAVLYDWARVAWGAESLQPDKSGTPQYVHPLHMELMFRQGTQYESLSRMETFYDPATGAALTDTRSFESSLTTDYPRCAGNLGCLGGHQTVDSRVSYSVAAGPVGTCGMRAPIHGASEAPSRMDVPGTCRDWRAMGSEQLTPYRLVEETTWAGKDALVYEAESIEGLRITYADGVPFPVVLETGFEEFVYEPYTKGRHFRLELSAMEHGGDSYPIRPEAVLAPPLPLVERTPDIHLDETGLSGFLLRDAYDAAMASTESPRLSDFMAKPNAYLAGAWKNIRIDDDDRIQEMWTMVATDGAQHLTKQVAYESPTTDLGLGPTALDQAYMVDGSYEYEGRLPHVNDLPDRLPAVAPAMARAVAFDGVDQPNLWGFWTMCVNTACTETDMAVRTGEELMPRQEANDVGTSGHSFHQHTVFFGPDGYVRNTYSMEADPQSGLLPRPLGGPSSVPPSASEGSAWTPPAAATAASLGFVALLSAAAYYFWPALKAGMLAPLFSRIADDKVLDHPRRRAIHDLIRADPGIHFQELSRRAGTGRGSLEHHLRKLRDADLVVRQQANGRTCYFPKGAIDHRDMQSASLLRADSTRRVYEAIQAAPGSQCADIARATGLSSPTVSYHLGKLRQAGLVGAGRSLFATA